MPNFLGTKHPARNFDLLSFYGMEWNEMQEKTRRIGSVWKEIQKLLLFFKNFLHCEPIQRIDKGCNLLRYRCFILVCLILWMHSWNEGKWVSLIFSGILPLVLTALMVEASPKGTNYQDQKTFGFLTKLIFKKKDQNVSNHNFGVSTGQLFH